MLAFYNAELCFYKVYDVVFLLVGENLHSSQTTGLQLWNLGSVKASTVLSSRVCVQHPGEMPLALIE